LISIFIESGKNKKPIKNPKSVKKYKNGKSGIFLYSFKKVYIREINKKLKNPDAIESFHRIRFRLSEKYIVTDVK
jgi:hypothetical protein